MEKKKSVTRKKGIMNTKKTATFKLGENGLDLDIKDAWHKVDGTPILDLEKYIRDYINSVDKYSVLQLLVGTDGLAHSITKNNKIIKLVTVICFYTVGKGAHVIKRRENKSFDRFVPTNEKLRMEVNKTYELSMYLKDIGITPIIHLDLNPDPTFGSSTVYEEVKGWFEALGFVTEYKSNAVGASYAADYYI